MIALLLVFSFGAPALSIIYMICYIFVAYFKACGAFGMSWLA